MKYIIRVFVIVLATAPFLASAQLPQFNVCNPTSGKECDFSSLIALANNLIRFCIILGTSVFSIVFMYAGFLYLTANGNTGKISQAHGLFWNAIIGFVIMLCAWLFVDFILKALVKSDPTKYRLLSN